MAKPLKDILKGVKASKIVPGSTGEDPGVDYAPKAPNDQEFVKLHKTEKHSDRVGNGDDVYQATNIKHSQIDEPKHGYKKPQDKSVNEAAKCNMTEEGTACPVHEMADCSKSMKTLKEVLTKGTPASEYIKDFQKSDNPKFAGKSKEKRKQMALAAYYSKQRNEEVELDESLQDWAAKHEKSGNKITKDNKTATYHAWDKDNKHLGSFKASHKIKEELAVPLLGSKDDDESAEMAKTQLRALANKALHLAMQLGDEQVVEPWVQAKIAVAKDHVSAVHDYMVYGDHSKDKENEQTAPYDGGIDMSGAPRNTFPSFSVDVNTGRNV